ncbi:TPA: peptide chain release factor N(5)-glutamine methyltransferase, partial [Candidatus Bipolaricaulota bacterium]|nr:peptide chain release factor N(5)-glutamine methyltransferase [Candidatus Bipolaricaulota bacterium]
GLPRPAREARTLLTLACFGDRPAPSSRLPPFLRGRFRRLVEARGRGVPLPFLEGRTGFLDFELKVWPGVLIPRPETEGLAERAIQVAQALPPRPRALDLGTGTGALACALARARPDLRVLAVDIDRRALACARWNVTALGLEGHVELRRSHWFSQVPERFHLIVSNPPYVARQELSALPPEVRRFESRRALDGGEKGLEALQLIVREAPGHLHPGGWLLLELAPGQGRELIRFAQATRRLVETRVEKDYAGKERYFIGRCR